uniref:Uncharacterized protein n=1 Tax=Pipistrellus kuhlii TaxID=59472 RepID=A0A7J7TXH3_PIPKU|nr:hypothetical protein mPipKuh1_009208 [Pipistrellus kuhlii]
MCFRAQTPPMPQPPQDGRLPHLLQPGPHSCTTPPKWQPGHGVRRRPAFCYCPLVLKEHQAMLRSQSLGRWLPGSSHSPQSSWGAWPCPKAATPGGRPNAVAEWGACLLLWQEPCVSLGTELHRRMSQTTDTLPHLYPVITSLRLHPCEQTTDS